MKGLFLESNAGNKYFYDDTTGIINPITGDSWTKEEHFDKYSSIIPVRQSLRSYPVDAQQVQDYLFRHANGFRQLILESTSSCNLRCKYCIYSDHYQYTKGYENAQLTFEVGKKAIDFYFENFKIIQYRNPNRKPVIGFYGGEPLINIKTIMEIVDYTKRTYTQYGEVLFNVTTNGVLFDKDVQKFLVDNGFSIIVSLDGNKENHDRNRVKLNGKGSFDEVIANIREFKRNYKDYSKFGISACYDLKSNLFDYEQFLDEEDLFMVKLARVEAVNSTYYQQFSHCDLNEFDEMMAGLQTKFYKLASENKIKKDSFLYALIGINYSELAFHSVINERRTECLPFTSTCVPGEKIYVTADGKIHMCEKINEKHWIGNVDDGLDYGKITSIVNEYNKNICDHCEDCNFTRFCSMCFVQCATDKGFVKSASLCSNIERSVRERLTSFLNILEERPDIFEDITVDYFNTIYEKGGERIEL
ncbi:radical SAM protein [Paenibacillus pedocola]|uniref:radical SAM protein n=1 Tax=Paenibacillus pedocola TaxID=3242193 RepID=UPI002877C94E|nr:radical SAM protein [Paenibacillus typhae]